MDDNERIVGQELLALDSRPSYHRFFWVRGTNGSSSEVDFVLPHGQLLVPIEAKSGANTKQKSLAVYMDQGEYPLAIRVSSNPFQVRPGVTPSGRSFKFVNVPYYYLSVIHGVIDRVLGEK